MSQTPSPWIRDVTEADFEREVLLASRERPVVVDFWAPWCGPCRMLGPLLEDLIAQRQGEILMARVNVDEAPNLAGSYGVSSIPAVKAFRNGQVFREFVGLLPEDYLRAFLDELLPSQAERLAEEARGLEVEKPAVAEKLYRQALQAESSSEVVRVGLARVLLAQGKTDEIDSLLEPVGSEGDVGEEAERIKAQVYLQMLAHDCPDETALRQRLAAEPDNARTRYELGCVLAAKGDYPAALDLLLSAGERDAALASSKVREAMVKVFYILGVHHPLANDYRGRLTRLLY